MTVKRSKSRPFLKWDPFRKICWFKTIKIEYTFVVTPRTVHNLGSKESYLTNKIERLFLIASTIMGTAQQRPHCSNIRQLEGEHLNSWEAVFPRNYEQIVLIKSRDS